MKWRRPRKRSGDIIDRRGRSGGVGMPAAVGLPGLVLVGVVFLVSRLLGGDTNFQIDDVFGNMEGGPPAEGPPPTADPDARLVDFMSFVLDDVQNFWEEAFRGSGKTYRRAELVLFDSSTSSQCGGAQSQYGPHYCPPDERVYIDLDFFKELRNRFDAPGDFAQAYVLAHEIGHHVQNVLGINADVTKEQRNDPDRANELSVMLELQADCLTGVWAHSTYKREILSSGDLQEGLDAAAAVGDDRIQEQSGGRVNPETWTHGSSEQRMRWFTNGFDSGDPERCDTFSADEL